MRVLIFVVVLSAGLNLSLSRPNSSAQSARQPTGAPCLFDAERGEVPNCLLNDANGELSVSPPLVKELKFDLHDLAAVHSRKDGWMYVNREGKVVITGVVLMDNWADTFHDGLVRFMRNNKYGFADVTGRTVIAPIYDGALNFENGYATVCKGCKSKCADPDCEYHFFSGGIFFTIDTKGTKRTQSHRDN